MKRLTLILAVVCTVFIGFGVGVSAFENGDVLDDYVTIKIDESNSLYNSLRSCNYWVRSGSNSFFLSDVPLIGTTDFYLIKAGSVFLILKSNGSSISAPTGNGYCQGGYISANYDIKDKSGNVVFQQAPPEEVPEQITPGLEGITTGLLLGVLQGLKPILLGLAVSVIGFLAFRKAWKWVLVQLHLG